MEPRAKVTRLSTAMELDMTSVVEETARLVVEQTMPALAQIHQQLNDVLDQLQTKPMPRQQMAAFLAASLPEAVGAINAGRDGATQQADALIKAGVGFVVYPEAQRYDDLSHEGAAQYVAERLAADAYPGGLPEPVRPRLEFVHPTSTEVTVRRVPPTDEIGTPNLAPGERVPAHGLEYRPDLLRRDDLEGWTSDLRG
jgi:hypothetical protein